VFPTAVATSEAIDLTGSPTQADILLRKGHSSPVPTGPAQDSDELALAKAFVRAGHEILGMRVRVLSATARTETGIEHLTPVFADHALCLSGRGNSGDTGVIALSLDLVSAIIEKSATGEVGNRPVPDRAGTSIDALFAEPLLKAMLENLALTCSPGLRPWIASVELAKKPSKTDDLEFEIAEGAHRVVMLQLQIDGAREGELVALIPQPIASDGASGGNAKNGNTSRDPAAGLRQKMLGSRTTLRADLISFDVPLAEFRNWSQGSEIQIPGDAIGAIALTQGGGISIARGRLGQANGHRAVRLNLPDAAVPQPALPEQPQNAHPNGGAMESATAEKLMPTEAETPTKSESEAATPPAT
jgi:flagellar motor switch protein FliM